MLQSSLELGATI